MYELGVKVKTNAMPWPILAMDLGENTSFDMRLARGYARTRLFGQTVMTRKREYLLEHANGRNQLPYLRQFGDKMRTELSQTATTITFAQHSSIHTVYIIK